ncbi:hypothetical protein NUU61_005123 [Penicillium alfredii]|uniref:Uncharacterized protein n=1 Tax=Penicillium alfredii TaxID=1506179 RepID=A0A9W9F983_9EURO|nr:uncharacterized protein NUU61_005123 [Penicillium alfredii]KAJ5095767.1 hypothetical protein NUU61_005123 [Penicillium alfredii]
MSRTDPRAATLFFKKHKTTVLLVLQPHESLESAQEKLLQALKSRGLTDINGDPIPDDPSDIEFGVAVDRHDLDKGWTRLDAEVPELNENGSKKGAGRPKKPDFSLQAAGLQDGHPVAFRFRKPTPEAEGAELDMDLDHEDPGWDVVVPSFEYEEEE